MYSRVFKLRASPATFDGLMDVDREVVRLEVSDPDLVLAFLPASVELQATLDAMAEVWPESLRCGCETMVQCAGQDLTREGCLHFFWLEHPGSRVAPHVITGSHAQPPGMEEVEALAERLGDVTSALALVDGMRFPAQELLTRLGRCRTVPRLAGGLASQPPPLDGIGSRIFVDTTIHPSACVLLALHGIAMHVEMFRGWEAASPIYTVTRAHGNVLYEIDGESSVDWYRRFFTVDGELAPMPETAYRFPLIVDGPSPTRRQLYRRMLAFDRPEGAVSYWGDIAEGDLVRLGIARPGAVRHHLEQLGSRVPSEAGLLWGWPGREPNRRGQQPDFEVAQIHEALAGTTLSGFLTFAEIGPDVAGRTTFHNQTGILALLREVAETEDASP